MFDNFTGLLAQDEVRGPIDHERDSRREPGRYFLHDREIQVLHQVRIELQVEAEPQGHRPVALVPEPRDWMELWGLVCLKGLRV